MDLPQGFTDLLTDKGLWGLALFALGTVVVVLDRRIAAIQEKRLEEAREGYAALRENTTALNALSNAFSQAPRMRR